MRAYAVHRRVFSFVSPLRYTTRQMPFYGVKAENVQNPRKAATNASWLYGCVAKLDNIVVSHSLIQGGELQIVPVVQQNWLCPNLRFGNKPFRP